tara:strand:- start:229 stop:474 length:246 start_codon:yes stop_codon:yes gene_type:complete
MPALACFDNPKSYMVNGISNFYHKNRKNILFLIDYHHEQYRSRQPKSDYHDKQRTVELTAELLASNHPTHTLLIRITPHKL